MKDSHSPPLIHLQLPRHIESQLERVKHERELWSGRPGGRVEGDEDGREVHFGVDQSGTCRFFHVI